MEIHEFNFQCDSCQQQYQFKDDLIIEKREARDPVAEVERLRKPKTSVTERYRRECNILNRDISIIAWNSAWLRNYANNINPRTTRTRKCCQLILQIARKNQSEENLCLAKTTTAGASTVRSGKFPSTLIQKKITSYSNLISRTISCKDITKGLALPYPSC